ncbi:unnamed protein product [Trichogramma brassicae]|uniref:Uncharacterized protein n=1 Tax=Trichogramma brassicae TaxID=86971 RepID=A0A6H5IW43_9HYME|nr:unnamed protein product [Trichogramma brassicae]
MNKRISQLLLYTYRIRPARNRAGSEPRRSCPCRARGPRPRSGSRWRPSSQPRTGEQHQRELHGVKKMTTTKHKITSEVMIEKDACSETNKEGSNS